MSVSLIIADIPAKPEDLLDGKNILTKSFGMQYFV